MGKNGSTNSFFHKIFITVLGINFGMQCIFIYGFGFFELMPKLNCFDVGKMESAKSCTAEQACSLLEN